MSLLLYQKQDYTFFCLFIKLRTEGKGFSSAEFIESFNIFNNTIIKGYQQLIQRYFLKMGIEIELNPFTYDNNTDDTNAN